MAVDHLPPQDIEAELSCLASIILNREALIKVTEILHPEDFYLDKHRYVYEAVMELERKNFPVDLITIKEKLIDYNLFDKIGGDAMMVDIYQTASTPANAEFYAHRVKEFSLRRKLIEVSAGITEKCHDRSIETSELMDQVEKDIFQVTEKRITSDFKDIADILQTTMANINAMHQTKKPITGIATGFTEIDETLTGLHESELLIIASRPAMGKTSLALNIANNVILNEKKPVLFFSLEMPATQLAMRLLCIEEGIDSQRVRTGHISNEELHKLDQASKKIGSSPLYIDDTPAVDILQLRAKARRMAQREKLGLIIVDYLQLVSSISKGRVDRHLQIAEISRGLKQIAGELSVPVLALSQLSRAVESRSDQYPQLSDLRESGSLEQDADVVMFIYREEKVKKESEKKGIAEIIIAKQRNGPTRSINLKFLDWCTKFGNLDSYHEFIETAENDH